MQKAPPRNTTHRSSFSPPWWDALVARARRYGRRFAVDPGDLAQATAEVYLARQEPPDAAAPWIERVLRNRAVDSWRNCQREAPSLAASSDARLSSSPTPLEELEAREERWLLEQACGALTPPERALLARRFHEGEVARLSSSERTRLRRLLNRLRRELGHLRAFAFPAWGLGAQGTIALVAVTPFLLAGTLGAGSGDAAALQRHVNVHGVARTEGLAPKVGRALEAPQVIVAAVVPDDRSATEGGPGLRGSAHGRASRETAAGGVETRFDFDEDQVEGALHAPDEILIDGRRPTKSPSLIELRRDFLPELVKGLEDLE